MRGESCYGWRMSPPLGGQGGMLNEEWRMKNEEWRMMNDEWRMMNDEWWMLNDDESMKRWNDEEWTGQAVANGLRKQ